MPTRPVVVLAGRHRPHELFLLAASVLIGVAYLAGSPPPNSLAALLDPWMVYAWAATMLISGTAGLVGCFWQRPTTAGLGLERGALTLQAAGTVLYTTALFHAGGWRALTAGAIAVAWSLANLARATQITRDLRSGAKEPR